MHFCTAIIMIGGDKDNTVFRDRFSPVSWIEVEVLSRLHGDDAVLEVKPFVRVDQKPRDEKVRLALQYGKEIVDAALGQGRGDNLTAEAPEADIAYGETWKNPITQLHETIEDEPTGKPRNSKGVFVKQAEATL